MEADYDVIVVGAGAAGIGAARRLTAAGRRTLLVEARDRVGGRTNTVDFHGHPYDLGAQFLHSASLNPMVGIAEGMGRRVERMRLDWNSSRIPNRYSEDDRKEIVATVEAFFELMDGPLDGDPSVAELLDRLPDQRYRSFIEAIWTWISSREAERCSAKDAARYNDTMEDWQVEGGYGSLILALSEGLEVALSCPVSVVRKTANGVEIDSARGRLTARRAIVALPSNILINEAVRFEPGLPAPIQEAIHAVPMGSAGKLLFRIAEPHPDLRTGARLRASVTDRATPSYHVSVFGAPILMGFFGGDAAKELEAAGTAAWADHAMEGLKNLLGSDIEKHLADPLTTGWNADPFSQGAYSAGTAGKAHLRPRLAEPFDERIFLAGEHTSVDFFSTVHGAFLSGERAADWVLEQG